eukprot:165401-Pyramimonas_sp.AAC.1
MHRRYGAILRPHVRGLDVRGPGKGCVKEKREDGLPALAAASCTIRLRFTRVGQDILGDCGPGHDVPTHDHHSPPIYPGVG